VYYIPKNSHDKGVVLLCVPCGALYRPVEFVPIYENEEEDEQERDKNEAEADEEAEEEKRKITFIEADDARVESPLFLRWHWNKSKFFCRTPKWKAGSRSAPTNSTSPFPSADQQGCREWRCPEGRRLTAALHVHRRSAECARWGAWWRAWGNQRVHGLHEHQGCFLSGQHYGYHN